MIFIHPKKCRNDWQLHRVGEAGKGSSNAATRVSRGGIHRGGIFTGIFFCRTVMCVRTWILVTLLLCPLIDGIPNIPM